jgi:hypothetical protein
VAFWCSLVDGEGTTGCGTSLRACAFDRGHRLRPGASGSGGWSGAPVQVSFGRDQAHRSAAFKIERRGQGGSPVRGREGRGERVELTSPSAMNSSRRARRCCGVPTMNLVVFAVTRAEEQREK